MKSHKISSELAISTASTEARHLWIWPPVPSSLEIYDKYKLETFVVVMGEPKWIFSSQGETRSIVFLPGEVGSIQQRLVLLTQAYSAPSTFEKFGSTITRKWELFSQLLETTPDNIKQFWDSNVSTIDEAKAGKSILKLAYSKSLGLWDISHAELVKSLSTRAKKTISAQKNKLRNRSNLIEDAKQMDVVRLLDEKANEASLSEAQVQALVTLALAFQHSVRPVQILTIGTEHVRSVEDSDGNRIWVISFHEAKKKHGSASLEMSRQVFPTWAPLVVLLLKFAVESGRPRLFSISSSEKLWKNVKKVCKEFGIEIDYKFYKLRHTGAQKLADAGHSRAEIGGFLGHSNINAAAPYLKSSRKQNDVLDKALEKSKVYNRILSIAIGEFVTQSEIEAANEDQQVGAIVGERLISGIGLCSTGQSACLYDPVLSCYSCKKYLPSLDASAHQVAIAGMRQQIISFKDVSTSQNNPAFLQLQIALAGAQRALDMCQMEKTRS